MTLIKSKFLFLVAGALVILLSAVCILFSSRRGKVLESWQTGNIAFAIRVTAHSETLSLPGLGGAYYVFDSNTVGSKRWTEILVFRHDTSVWIPRDQLRFVNDKIGYVFMGWMYGVTTDAGATWSVWNAERDLPNWQCCNYNLIKDVKIAPDGVGTMRLNPIPQRRGEVPELHTIDYGRHWSVD
jgi:hypothetical protein